MRRPGSIRNGLTTMAQSSNIRIGLPPWMAKHLQSCETARIKANMAQST